MKVGDEVSELWIQQLHPFTNFCFSICFSRFLKHLFQPCALITLNLNNLWYINTMFSIQWYRANMNRGVLMNVLHCWQDSLLLLANKFCIWFSVTRWFHSFALQTTSYLPWQVDRMPMNLGCLPLYNVGHQVSSWWCSRIYPTGWNKLLIVRTYIFQRIVNISEKFSISMQR